ncbi:MAG: STAS domain-containing protein [Planctomycetota bacterium]
MASEHLTVQAYQNLVLATVTKSRLTDAATINDIGLELLRQLELYPRISLIIHLGQVSQLSSAMLGKIIAVHKKVVEYRGRMAITGVGKELSPLFKVTKLDKVLDVRSDDAEKVLLEYRRTSA